MNNGRYYKKLAPKRHALCLNIVTLWRQIVVNDCLQKLIGLFSNTSKSFSISVLIVLLPVSRSKHVLFGEVCGKELSFGRKWIHKGINVYLYFMVFCNIKNMWVKNVILFLFPIYVHPKTKMTAPGVQTYDAEIEYWNNLFWESAILKI